MNRAFVVDTNFLRIPDLEDYLRASERNFVALAEHTRTECCQGDGLKNLEKSLAILGRYSRQVLILKSEKDLAALNGNRHRALVRGDLTDAQQTAEFGAFCEGVRAASRGDLTAIAAIRQMQDEANARADELLNGARLVAEGVNGIAKRLDEGFLHRLRKGESMTAPDLELVRTQVLLWTRLLFEGFDPHGVHGLGFASLRATFPFRKALCCFVLTLLWLEVGGIGNVAMPKLKNDLVDANIAAFATYFDGVLSNDAKLRSVHDVAAHLLREMFGGSPGM